MAKSVKTLDDFSGGLNLRSDAKDLEDNEFAEARNISNVAGGKLTQSGGLKGSSFIPSTSNTISSIDTNDTTAPDQGYGIISFNMDTAFIDGIAASFDEDFDDDTWTDINSGGTTNYDSGNDRMEFNTGTGSTNYGGIYKDVPSVFADGDLCWVRINITAASSNHSDTDLGRIIVYLGNNGGNFTTPDMNPENWVRADTYLQFVTQWGSDSDRIQILYQNMGGTENKQITINEVIIKKIPTTGSNNTVICTGGGDIVLQSSINDALYTGSSRTYLYNSSNGIMGSRFSDSNVDMSFDNGILKVQNKNEVMQWMQVDRTRTLVGEGTNNNTTVRNIEQVNYSSGSGYTISGSYAMDFPKFTLGDAVDKTNTSGVTTLLNPKFSEQDITYVSSNPDRGVVVEFNNGASGTAILADGSITKTWYLGASLLLDDEMQETEITWETEYLTVSGSYMPDVKMLIRYAPFHGREMWDPRVTGFRVWMSETSAGGGDPLQLIECNLINMTYSIYGTSHLNYSLILDGGRINHLKPNISGDTAIQLDTLPAIKFSELHGYLASEAIYACGKTSTIVGANKYLGNFTQAGITYEDQIIKSDVLMHDIFPSNNFVDVAPNDGDEIVSLMSFGEELIVFKKRTMYVLTGADTEDVLEISLEADYPGLGIQQPSQACETEKGIAWINGAGLYLYDGDVTNLSETQMTESTLRIKDDNTFDSLDESEGIAIGYDIENKKLVYSSGGSNQNFMIYDFKTETFHPAFGTYGTAGSDRQTNFVQSTSVATNKTYLLYGSQSGDDTMELWHYDDGPISSGTGTGTSAKFLYVTKDMSFGNPTTRKKVIGVYVTYKASATTNVIPCYAVDSARPSNWTSGTSLFNSTTSLFIDGDKSAALESGDKTFKTTAGAWRTVYLKPAAAINNIYTFQFAMISNDTVPSTFEINDITVVYREKSQK